MNDLVSSIYNIKTKYDQRTRISEEFQGSLTVQHETTKLSQSTLYPSNFSTVVYSAVKYCTYN